MPSSTFPELSACLLCGAKSPLQSSHILPDFLFRRLKATRHGRFFSASAPRKWIQAGPTASMLCSACEQLFSKDENSFQRVFHPTKGHPALPLPYGPWLYRLATSVSWRALSFLKYSKPHSHANLPQAAIALLPSLDKANHEAADMALAVWSKVLLGATHSAPAPFEQHIVLLNGKNVPYEHAQAVGFTAYETADTAGVMCQLGMTVVLGFVRSDRPDAWIGTRIDPAGGVLTAHPSQMVPESFAAWLYSYFANMNALRPYPAAAHGLATGGQ